MSMSASHCAACRYGVPILVLAVPIAPTYAILQYYGHNFAGWQRQKAERTVQGEFERVLEALTGRRVVTHAAGRTDAGVHALAQLVSFSLSGRWNPPDLMRALNALLPHDVWVSEIGHAPTGFNARRDATARRYRYVVGCDAASLSPFRRPFEWPLARPLDAHGLHAAATFLLGEHDFRAFSARGQRKPHYRCRISTSQWTERPDSEGFIFTIEADRFLHRMVRFLVGTMVEIGRGRRPVEDIPSGLGSRDNADAGPPAPSQGLYLLGARYPQLKKEPVQ